MKKFLIYGLLILVALSLCGCSKNDCEHLFGEANCQTPKTCSLCGKVEGTIGAHKYENNVCALCGNLTRAAKEIEIYVNKNQTSLTSLVNHLSRDFGYKCQSKMVAKGENIIVEITIDNYQNLSPNTDASLKEFSNRVLVKLDDRAKIIKEHLREFKSINCNFYTKSKTRLLNLETGKITEVEKYIIKHPKKLAKLTSELTSATEVRCNAEIAAKDNGFEVNVTLLDITAANESTYDTINTMKQALQPHLATLLLTLQKDLPDTEIICNFYSQGGQLI